MQHIAECHGEHDLDTGCVSFLQIENARLKEDLDRLTQGTWSMEIARQSKIASDLRAENVRLQEALEDLERQRNQEFDRAEDAECRFADAQMALVEALEEAQGGWNKAAAELARHDCNVGEFGCSAPDSKGLCTKHQLAEAQGKLDRIEAAAGFGPLKDVARRQRNLGLEGDHEGRLREGRVTLICAILRGSKEGE